jgi:serine protease Do
VAVYFKPEKVTGIQEHDLNRRVKSRVVAFDRSLDLALLQLETTPSGIAPLILGDPEQVRIGDRVVAIGHPEQGGLWTLTTGVISSEFEDFQKIPGKNVFQTEASFNRGNSGGPLLDAYGHQVGINTSIARQAADGMAIVSINFSLKSSVAQIWLKKQGVQVVYAIRPADQSAGSASVQAVPPVVPTPSVPAVPEMPTTPSLPSAPPLPQDPSKAPSSGVPTTPGLPASPTMPPQPSPPSVPTVPSPAPHAKGSTVPPGTPSRPGPEAHVPPDPHPYDLDRLVQGLEAAEKDLEDLMGEMQKKTRRRP